jgi:demethylmenaquinone methyltransferase/2-methoxy-6-polyprenyl-1,4-benzoquinol methylase
MQALPFPAGVFDWGISVDCLGYPAGDLLPALKGLRRAVRPGGLIALLAWTSQQLLPGYSMLEARLNASCSPYAPFLQGRPSEAHFQRALRWFPEAGLGDGVCRTFVGQLQAPLGREAREGVAMLFEMLWGTAIEGASEADREEYLRLCSPTSEHFIADLPEYCGFFTYTMFRGRVLDRA